MVDNIEWGNHSNQFNIVCINGGSFQLMGMCVLDNVYVNLVVQDCQCLQLGMVTRMDISLHEDMILCLFMASHNSVCL